MTPKSPAIDVFIGRDGDVWRMYFAPRSWVPLLLFRSMGPNREIYPVARPDADDLDRHMWESDSPYEARKTSDGGLEIRAAGRSAICLLLWLEDLVKRGARSGLP
jgi:hypothetical protein